MNPKYKPLIFVLLVFVLLVPYLGFVLYYSPQFPPNQWPSWFTNTIAIWFVVNFLILMLLGKRIFRGQPAEAVEPQNGAPCLSDTASIWWVPCDCLEHIVSLRVERNDSGRNPSDSCNPGGRVLALFHRDLFVEYLQS
jgi:hypothetical protein